MVDQWSNSQYIRCLNSFKAINISSENAKNAPEYHIVMDNIEIILT